MWRIIGLSVIPGLILIIQNGMNLDKSLQLLQMKYLMKANIHYSLEVGKIIHSLQIERGVMSLFASSAGDSSVDIRLKEEVEIRLTNAFNTTDTAVTSISKWAYSEERDTREEFSEKDVFRRYLNTIRDRRTNLTHTQIVNTYSENNQVFIEWMVGAVKEDRNNEYWADVVAYHMLINGKECVGIERAIGTYFFTNGYLNKEMLFKYKGCRDLGETFFLKVRSYSSVAGKYISHYVSKELEDVINDLRAQVLNNRTSAFSVDQASDWVDNMTAYINQLDNAKRQLANYITQKTEEEIAGYQLNVVVDVVVLVVTIGVASLVSFIIYKISKSISVVKDKLQEKTEHLVKEQQRTESLLSQLVPAKIAKRMQNNKAQTDVFESVTVMYAEMANLDSFIAKATPNDVLTLVNDVYDVYEIRVEKYNVSKIGATGNVMLVAAGLGQTHGQKHASEIARLALDVLDAIYQIQTTFGDKIKLRIGISTGLVVAGLIHGRLPRYCIFGETVTRAKQMMETCLPLQIHMTETTRHELSTQEHMWLKERVDTNKKNGSTGQKTFFLSGNTNESVKQFDLEVINSVEV